MVATAYVLQLFKHVVSQDTSARNALNTFLSGKGDVLLDYESDAIAAQKAAGRAKGGACASDAFYPFPDGIEAAAAQEDVDAVRAELAADAGALRPAEREVGERALGAVDPDHAGVELVGDLLPDATRALCVRAACKIGLEGVIGKRVDSRQSAQVGAIR